MKDWDVEILLVNEFGRVEDTRPVHYNEKTSAEVTQAIKESISATALHGQRYQIVVTATDGDWFSFNMSIG